jgi:hypothetical protein
MKISIIIACVDKHIPLLKQFLQTTTKFSIKPHEIIIFLSPYYIKDNPIKYLEETKNALEEKYDYVKCLVQTKQTHSSRNRNLCMKAATGDIFVIHDADDIMHWQCLEIINKVFEENPGCKMFLYNYLKTSERDYSLKQFKDIDLKKTLELKTDFKTTIKWRHPWGMPLFIKSYHKVKNFCRTSKANYYCNSFFAISKDVFQEVKYNEDMFFGEDANFIRDIHEKYESTYYTSFTLSDYIESRSWKF